MVNTYVLVNPHIEGTFEKKIQAKNSVEAGKALYKSLSEHFNNYVPKFIFTIQKGTSGKGKNYSFITKESKDPAVSDEVNFSIEPYQIKNEEQAYSRLHKGIKKFEKKLKSQHGGKKKKKSKKDDDSSEDSSSEEYYVKKKKTYSPYFYEYPLYYWHYDPLIYGIKSVSVPTFYPYTTPIIDIVIS